MQSYYKIYHYSPQDDLQNIDPNYYGSSTQRTKLREGGLNKSYFYTIDSPESCVASRTKRYEIYLPYEWKKLIYDIGQDSDGLYDKVFFEIKNRCQREPYAYELKEELEQYLWKTGYKGFANTRCHALPHAITLFYSLPTKQPAAPNNVYNWAGELLEQNTTPVLDSGVEYGNQRFFAAVPSRPSVLSDHIVKLPDTACANRTW